MEQLMVLLKVAELGTMSDAADALGMSISGISKDIKELEHALGIPLRESEHRTVKLSEQGKVLVEDLKRWFELWKRVIEKKVVAASRVIFHIGTGGGTASWLVGNRRERVKQCFEENDGHQITKPINPDDVALRVRSGSHREVVWDVISGVLDCGIVRAGVVQDSRLPLKTEHIGTIYNSIYVKLEWLPHEYQSGERLEQAKIWGLPEPIERSLLEKWPIATVGPDGEMRERLDEALRNEKLYPKIEFSYDTFLMVLPHLLQGTHLAIMPHLDLFGASPPAPYVGFPLRILAGYMREMMLIVHSNYAKRLPELVLEKLIKAVSFPKTRMS